VQLLSVLITAAARGYVWYAQWASRIFGFDCSECHQQNIQRLESGLRSLHTVQLLGGCEFLQENSSSRATEVLLNKKLLFFYLKPSAIQQES
jgi:hypothetical protein